MTVPQTVASAPSRLGAGKMAAWHLREKDLKKYPHFDKVISEQEGEALATDPDKVARHSFFPFMRYTDRWNRFSEKGAKGKAK